MIQFYKKRSFGDFVADTFNFLKIYGKNYFKNYLLINGLLLILMMLLMVLGLKDIFAYFMEGTMPDSSFVEDYFSENVGLLVAVFAIMFLLFLVAMVVNYAYPVLYLKRLIETNVKSIKLDDIFGDIKANLGKLSIFLVGLIFIVGPLATMVIGLSYVLVFIIIGFFLLILVTPVVMNSINFLLFDYLNTSRGFLHRLVMLFVRSFLIRTIRKEHLLEILGSNYCVVYSNTSSYLRFHYYSVYFLGYITECF